MRSRTLRSLRRRREAGMTLVEIMIVVIIMALIAAAVGVAVIPRWRKAQEESTRTDAQTVRSAVSMFIVENAGAGCPSMEDLAEGGYVDTSKRMVDAWGNEFEIECTGNEIGIFSAGADGQFSTEDDID